MTVYFVGAGPGDPGLLTARGAELLALADVVVYDQGFQESLLGFAPPGAECIGVTKNAGGPILTQQDIITLLVEQAKAGRSVVRLTGSGPLDIVRGNEEAVALTEAGIHYEVVPGVQSALVAPADADLAGLESRPLFGKTVIVTRPKHQISTLAGRLRGHGAKVVLVPTIEIADPADGGAALRDAVSRLQEFDWVIFTSVNGAERFFDQLGDTRDLAGVRIAAIGPGTADAVTNRNLAVDLVPERFIAESLLEAFPIPHGKDKGRVLLARAEVARDVVPDGLRQMGWEVEIVDAYRTVPVIPTEGQREAAKSADIVTFTSASSVKNWVEAFGFETLPPIVACIGPVTSDAAYQAGIRVDVIAKKHTVDGLVDAVIEFITH